MDSSSFSISTRYTDSSFIKNDLPSESLSDYDYYYEERTKILFKKYDIYDNEDIILNFLKKIN